MPDHTVDPLDEIASRAVAGKYMDHWAHDPKVCGTLDCPGCWAASYVPRAETTNGDGGES